MSSLPASASPTCISLMAGVEGAQYFLYMGPKQAKSEQGILTFGELPCDHPLTDGMHTRFYLDVPKKEDDELAELRHVKCAYTNQYLLAVEQDGKLLIGTADEPEEDLSKPSCTLFKLSFHDPKQDDKTKAKMYTVGSKGNILLAAAENFTEKAKVQIEEPVIYREIYNFKYRTRDHHRLYDTTNMIVDTVEFVNRSNKDSSHTHKLAFKSQESSRWESTTIHKISAKTSIKFGLVPKLKVFEVQAEFGYEHTNSTTWGSTNGEEREHHNEHTLIVPSHKKVTLVVTATQAKYDVPFSYTQKDTMPNGEIKIQNYDDGLYTGMSCFNVRYDTTEDEIPAHGEGKTAASAQ